MEKIVIAGGTGFIGSYLEKKFLESGYQVILISRNGHVTWSDPAAVNAALNNAFMVINLAGKSIDCRHNEKNRKEIIGSRINATTALGKAMLKTPLPPKIWINASGASIYGVTRNATTEESTPVAGNFAAQAAIEWEKSFFRFNLPSTRMAALRFGVVIGRNGGALKPLKRLVRFGLGGKHGKGNQMFSWIHEEDIFGIIMFLAANEEMNGVINCTTPHPVSNKELMKSLRNTLGMPVGIPAPEWLLKMATAVIQKEASLLLDDCNVVPEKLIKAGYMFRFGEIEEALKRSV